MTSKFLLASIPGKILIHLSKIFSLFILKFPSTYPLQSLFVALDPLFPPGPLWLAQCVNLVLQFGLNFLCNLCAFPSVPPPPPSTFIYLKAGLGCCTPGCYFLPQPEHSAQCAPPSVLTWIPSLIGSWSAHSTWKRLLQVHSRLLLPHLTRTFSLVCLYPPSYLNAQLDVLLVGTLSPEAVIAGALQAAVEEHVAVVGVHFVQYD